MFAGTHEFWVSVTEPEWRFYACLDAQGKVTDYVELGRVFHLELVAEQWQWEGVNANAHE